MTRLPLLAVPLVVDGILMLSGRVCGRLTRRRLPTQEPFQGETYQETDSK